MIDGPGCDCRIDAWSFLGRQSALDPGQLAVDWLQRLEVHGFELTRQRVLCCDAAECSRKDTSRKDTHSAAAHSAAERTSIYRIPNTAKF
jgi:hypothetical protein